MEPSLILIIPLILIVLLLGAGTFAITRGTVIGIFGGIVMVVLGVGLVVALPFLPIIAFFGLMWFAGSYGGPGNRYEPPPGTPTEIALSYRIDVTLEAADGSRGTDTAVQTVTIAMGKSDKGLSKYDGDWKASGEDIKVRAGGRVYVTDFDYYRYARHVVDACIPKASYTDFPEFVAAIQGLKAPCKEAIPRFFIGPERPPKKASPLPINMAYVDKDVRAIAFSVTPLGVKVSTPPEQVPASALSGEDAAPNFVKIGG